MWENAHAVLIEDRDGLLEVIAIDRMNVRAVKSHPEITDRLHNLRLLGERSTR